MERSEEQLFASISMAATTMTRQEPVSGEKQLKKTAQEDKKQKHLPPEPYSHGDVVRRDVRDLLGAEVAGRDRRGGEQVGESFQL